MDNHEPQYLGRSCTKCKLTLPLSDFGTSRGHRGGINPWCKACVRRAYHQRGDARKAKEKAYRADHKAQTAERQRKWASENRERKNEQARAWRARKSAERELMRPRIDAPPGFKACSGCNDAQPVANFSSDRSKADGLATRCKACKARGAASHRARNAERIRQAKADYYAKNRDRIVERYKDHYEANAVAYKARAMLWAKQNPDKVRARSQAYFKAHRDRWVTQAARRRGFLAAAEKTLTGAEWHSICGFYGWGCAYCGDTTLPVTMDHMKPLSRGGAHSWRNVVPCCLPCNQSKGKRTPEEWEASKMQIAMHQIGTH